jgi:hypothetical protein
MVDEFVASLASAHDDDDIDTSRYQPSGVALPSRAHEEARCTDNRVAYCDQGVNVCATTSGIDSLIRACCCHGVMF